jgi:hypothetical protein
MGDKATAGGRPGYWFPLVLLGFGLLAMLGWNSARTAENFGFVDNAPGSVNTLNPGAQYLSSYLETSFTSVVVVQFDVGRFPMRTFPWPVLVITMLVATVAWYGWRARGPVRTYVLLAVGGVVAVLVAYCAVGIASGMPDPAGMVTSVGLPLAGLGVLAGAWAYLRLGPWRRAAAVLSVVCLTIGVGTVLGAWAPGLLEPVLIAGGLLALARFERSRLLAIVAVLVLAAMVTFPVSTMSMLVPAAVVLAAAIVLLLRQLNAAEPG